MFSENNPDSGLVQSLTFGGPLDQRWSFYVSGQISQLGISEV